MAVILGVVFLHPVPVGLSSERRDRFRADQGWKFSEQRGSHITLSHDGTTNAELATEFTVVGVPYTIVLGPEPKPEPEPKPAPPAPQTQPALPNALRRLRGRSG